MNEKMKAQGQQLIAKCWSDEAFKQRLLAEPAATLKQEGWEIPEGLTLKIVADTDQVVYLVIPMRPENPRDEELESCAGGYKFV